MEPVRVGVIGCGVIGRAHMTAATNSPDLELTAASDLVPANREFAKEKFNPKRLYESGEELLADPDVEAVVLAFPTTWRTPMALKAFEAGKHVLTEKPVAMNVGEVRRMIAAKGELFAACCSCRYRFTEGARVAAEFIATGALGDLRIVRHRNLTGCGKQPDSPRPEWRLKKALNGGGFLVNWGCYDLDYLLGITGWTLKPVSVFAQTWTVPPIFESHVAPGSDAETHYLAMVRCEGGTILNVERAEFVASQRQEAWGIVGSKGSLQLKMTASKPNTIIYDRGSAEDGVITETLWEEDEVSRIHDGPLTDFALAIRTGSSPKTPLEKALVAQLITDGIYASAERGESVLIEEL
ncbi:MAG: Gfo/Idh/MocA family oxidoreductase [Candidatus Poribacteria bacterium]|nr:Gfo/Idh/MocA family oxidoreductase [Candidatus Poribacteria bacterium]